MVVISVIDLFYQVSFINLLIKRKSLCPYFLLLYITI